MHATAFRAVLAAFALAAVLVAAAWDPGDAFAQEPAKESAPQAPKLLASGRSVEESRVLGVLAWRRAVWTSEEQWFERAAAELTRVRMEKKDDTDFTSLFLLGHAYARLRRRADANAAWVEADALARKAGVKFPGFLLAEALVITADKAGHEKQQETEQSRVILDRFLTEMARYDRSKPFAAELLYLGVLERGLRSYALQDLEAVFRDLERARELVKAEGRTPAVELVRVLIQARKDVQEFGVAAEIAEEAIRRQPGEATHYYVRATVAAEAKEDEVSRRWHERALELRPDYAESHAKLAFLAHERKDTHGMRRHLECYAALLQDQWNAAPITRTNHVASNLQAGWGMYWLDRGDAAMDAGDAETARRNWEAARDAYTAAYQEEPGCVRTLVSLVRLYSVLKAPQDQIAVWTRRAEDQRDAKPGAPKGYRDTFC